MLQLLVGIVSTYEKQQHQETENELFQEVLKKAIYAVSAAARGNVDVQNSLQAVSDRTDDVDVDKNGLVGNGLFLDSLYNISMNTNRTHAGRKITYIHTNIHTYTYFKSNFTLCICLYYVE